MGMKYISVRFLTKSETVGGCDITPYKLLAISSVSFIGVSWHFVGKSNCDDGSFLCRSSISSASYIILKIPELQTFHSFGMAYCKPSFITIVFDNRDMRWYIGCVCDFGQIVASIEI
jgi:hypothetical protein